MVGMKQTLLSITQDLLNELDGDDVNSISDTIESTQIADIIVATYFDLVALKKLPELKELFKLDALADSTRPNYLKLPTDVQTMEWFKYDKSDDAKIEYRYVKWTSPTDFISLMDSRDSSQSIVTTVSDINGGTSLLIYNDRMPTWYTTFDDLHIVCDSYDAALETTLQAANTQCWGSKIPTVTLSDGFEFDMDAQLFPYLRNEALARASLVQQKTVNAKAEQWAKRHKFQIEANKYRTTKPEESRGYGRHNQTRRALR